MAALDYEGLLQWLQLGTLPAGCGLGAGASLVSNNGK
jgi:hypothetical protein